MVGSAKDGNMTGGPPPVRGGGLSRWQPRPGGRALSAPVTLDYAIQTSEGLAAAHAKGTVYRDVKPDNLFVTNDGHVKVFDFGLAPQPEIPVADGRTEFLLAPMELLDSLAELVTPPRLQPSIDRLAIADGHGFALAVRNPDRLVARARGVSANRTTSAPCQGQRNGAGPCCRRQSYTNKQVSQYFQNGLRDLLLACAVLWTFVRIRFVARARCLERHGGDSLRLS
jgi:serine/threonine protein kinase